MSDDLKRLREIVRNYVKAEDAYLSAYPETDTSQLKKKVDDLQKELNDYIKTDTGKIQSALDNNTQALRDLREIILLSKK